MGRATLGAALFMGALTLSSVGTGATATVPAIEGLEPGQFSMADVVEVDIMTLTSIDWEAGEEVPEHIRELSGKVVLIRGYMHQSVHDETNRFPFVSDVCQCVGRLMPHHFIDVYMGQEITDPLPGQFEVLGRFNVGERLDEDGFVTSLYRLRGRIF